MPRSMRTAVVLAALAGALSAAAPALAGGSTGQVYTLTNAAAGNAVAVFDRAKDGTLAPAGTVATGGLGSGGGLGSQGAIVREGRRLLAVNAGSGTVALLRIRPGGPVLRDVAPAGGSRPISVTARGRLVYVLNDAAGGAPASIAGFWRLGGRLVPLPGSARPLSEAAPGPAQIQFTPDGRRLVVTEKATNRILTYAVGPHGYAGPPVVSPSAGQTPFGFDFDRRGTLIVSEAFGGALDASVLSSYRITRDGAAVPVDGNVATTETAACWVVVSKNGRYAYATNTGSNSISGFGIAPSGDLTLLDADGRTATTGAGPIDAALSRDGAFLYALDAGSDDIVGFRVRGDGRLEPVGSVGGLPAAAVGLASS